MKLKLVVALVTGIVSVNAFASDDTQAQLDAMKAQIAQMQATINANSAGTRLPNDSWFNRIAVSGMLNTDGEISRKYSPVNFTETNPSRLVVNNANLFVDANVSDWTKAHIGLIYSSDNNGSFKVLRPGAFTYNQLNSSTSLFVDEAYATISNFAKSPFFMKAGKQYVPFGSYTPYADITPSLVQDLSQTNGTAVVTGFVANNGVHGSIYGLQGLDKANITSVTTGSAGTTQVKSTKRATVSNFGASLGVDNVFKNVAYKLGLDYIYNMADVTEITYALGNPINNPGLGTNNIIVLNGDSGYVKAVGGIAANAGFKYKRVDASAKFVSALRTFSQYDMIYVKNGQTAAARPAAWAFDAGYSFPVLAHDSRFSLGYQGTKQSADINSFTYNSTLQNSVGLPQARYLADYTVNVSKYTDLGFEVRHDKDYSVNNGGTGHGTNTATARLAVKFA